MKPIVKNGTTSIKRLMIPGRPEAGNQDGSVRAGGLSRLGSWAIDRPTRPVPPSPLRGQPMQRPAATGRRRGRSAPEPPLALKARPAR